MSDFFKDTDVNFDLRANKALKVTNSRKTKKHIGRKVLLLGLVALLTFNIHFLPYEINAASYRLADSYINNEYPGFDYLYDEYVTGIANIITEIGYDNDPIKVFCAFLNLNVSGYISVGDEYTTEEPSFETYNREGVSVLLGNGVCRNQSELLYRVMKKLGYDVNFNCGRAYSDGLDGMHAVVSVYYNDTLVLMDPTNFCFFLNDGTGTYKSVSAFKDDDVYHFEMSKSSDVLYDMNDSLDNSRYNRKVDDYSFFADSLRDEFVAFFVKTDTLDIDYQALEDKYLGDVEERLTSYIIDNFSLTDEELESINSKNLITRIPTLFNYMWKNEFLALNNQITDSSYISSDEASELSSKIR